MVYSASCRSNQLVPVFVSGSKKGKTVAKIHGTVWKRHSPVGIEVWKHSVECIDL
jgi:hypothetical protein